MRWTQPFDENDRLLGMVELNYILQHQDPAQDDRIDHWRFRVDRRHRLSQRIEFSAAYSAARARAPERQDRLSHVPSLSLTYGF